MSVYFITAREVGRVKIGCAYRPAERLRLMQVCCPVELKLEAFTDGFHKEERELHRRFADLRVRGEWFELTPKIEALIQFIGPPQSMFGGALGSNRKFAEAIAELDANREIAAAIAEMEAAL